MRKALNRIKLLIFDLDDTLYPEIEYVKSGFSEISNKIFDKYGINKEQFYCNLLDEFKKKREEVFNRVLQKFNLFSEELLNELIRIYRYHKPRISPYKDLVETIDMFKEKYHLGLISDGDKYRQILKLESLGLLRYFEKCIFTNDLGPEYHKPSVKPFMDMVNHFNLSTSEALYIGDNVEKDFYGPNQIGIFTVRIVKKGIYSRVKPKNRLYRQKLEIKSFHELAKYLK